MLSTPGDQDTRRRFKGGRRGTAEPYWGWSGAAPLVAVPLSAADIDLETLLPGHRSPTEEILQTLSDLGARYRRYLHQDESGPTRAQRMAALRLLLDQFDLLASRLNELPQHLRLALCERLPTSTSAVPHDFDRLEAYRNDQAAVQQLDVNASDAARMLFLASETGDAEQMADLSGTAQRTLELLCALDTTTAGAIVVDGELPGLEIPQGPGIAPIDLAIVRARIERLQHRVAMLLVRLEERRGAERHESLRWLVWQLCDLYHYETGRRVTNSAVDVSISFSNGSQHAGAPRSPAGQFVLAAAECLGRSPAWARELDYCGAPRRNRAPSPGPLKGPTYFAMRDYVAHHPDPGRRGRKRG